LLTIPTKRRQEVYWKYLKQISARMELIEREINRPRTKAETKIKVSAVY